MGKVRSTHKRTRHLTGFGLDVQLTRLDGGDNPAQVWDVVIEELLNGSWDAKPLWGLGDAP